MSRASDWASSRATAAGNLAAVDAVRPGPCPQIFIDGLGWLQVSVSDDGHPTAVLGSGSGVAKADELCAFATWILSTFS